MTDHTPTDKDEISRQMRLRAAPPPVMRLSRKALVAIGGVSALALAAALGFALLGRPASSAKPELYRVGGPPPETLQTLPADYTRRAGSAGVPQLGPPLPGDLGRPILAAQANGVDVSAPAIGSTATEPDPARTAADAARQRAVQESETARLSILFLSGVRPAGSTTTEQPADAALLSSTQGAEQPRSVLGLPPPPFTVQAGAIISGALVTGLRSDLPGAAIGQVTDDVYDSVSGRHLLIPKGSRLIGAYEADVAFGQSRLSLIWTRLILPNGRAITLDDMRATDPQGFSGLEDRIDNRWGERLRTAALTTVLAVGSASGVSSGDDAIARALTQGVSGGVNAFGEGLVAKGLDVAPRLTIRPGFAFRVIVSRDLVLEPYGDR
ncbi:TrbI/VirB10 family protein [Brevundimonas goettingensis]|uniref:TrbI/VirB10 family protein n=1 Tax=Brevundimonas goettingensis TaxID=2774190 RepID=A0A975GUL6_9CAUL|nr:TrbI/VirB10 family protein [Brevundimonas goettingensis]QTC90311.1 TrbI/VirB10 family protein [Brevundimonas goettingensis]